MPLDTLRRPTTDDRRPTGAGVLGVATDLIEFDEHYRPVAQNLLGRTLIVTDLPTARQTLRQLSGGWTLVTLAGEQVNTSGAVTGGAQTKEAGTLRRERELRELPDQVAAQRDAVARAAQARAALDGRLDAAERARREAESARQRSRQEYEIQRAAIEKLRRSADQAAAERDLQLRRHEQNAVSIADLGEQQAALEQEQAALAAREIEAHEQLARLRAEDQGRLDAERVVQQRVAALRSAAAASEGEARAERALLQSNAQNLARLEDQRAAGLRRMDELAQERAVLQAQLHAHQVAHEGLLAQIDALRAEINPAENEQAALEAAQADLERREAELTSALLTAESAHGRATVDVQRARDRIDTLWERAAADDIDIEGVGGSQEPENQEPRTGEPENQEPGTESQVLGSGETDTSTLETQSLATGTASVAAAESLESNIQHPISETQGLEPQPSALSTQSSESAESLESKIQQLKSRIQRLGVINPLALEEYDEASERHSFLTSQTSDLRQAELSLRELIAELDSAMQARFEATFRAVAAEFERSFTRLFGGGQAQLLLSRSNGSSNGEHNGESNGEMHAGVDDLGVEILARPPGKRQQTLSLLSGGERTLTAAALLFAILKVNPSPFCVLDEVDAALDEANVGRFREALTDLSQQTQFLLVTHNRGTIEAADTIYGVSMGEDGASRVLSLRLEELVED
jgi:chromosome segregation protein